MNSLISIVGVILSEKKIIRNGFVKLKIPLFLMISRMEFVKMRILKIIKMEM